MSALRPGDLAIVVKVRELHPVNQCHIGKIVTAVDRSGGGGTWATDPVLYDIAEPNKWISFEDDELRPIRDNDGEDETLTWAGKPSDIKTPEAA